MNNILFISIFIKLNLLFNIINCELNFGNDLENNRNFKSVPTTVKTFENDTVLLPCYHNTPFRYVRWHHDDVALVDSRHPEKPAPDRVTLWSNGSLQVANVQAEDTGDYYCEIMSESSRAVQMHAIEVQYPAQIISDPDGVLELPIGAIFEMICEAKGVPQPIITWKHNHVNIDRYQVGNRQSYLVDIKSRAMSGPIECVATNGVGEPAVSGVYLNVLFPPEIHAAQNTVYVKIGMRAHLECIVESAPTATVQWFRYGLPVTSDAHLSRHDSELQSNHSLDHYYTETRHILTLKKVRDADIGVYECRAENRFGAKRLQIEVTGRPMASVFKINPGIQNSTAHVLVWQTESLSPISEFKLKFRQIPSGNVTPQNIVIRVDWTELTIPSDMSVGPIYTTSYTLYGLQPASVFEAMVLARNHFGWSDNSRTVRFATGGEVELPNYSTESEMLEDDILEADDDDLINEITQSSHIYAANDQNRNRANISMRTASNLNLIVSFVILITSRTFLK